MTTLGWVALVVLLISNGVTYFFLRTHRDVLAIAMGALNRATIKDRMGVLAACSAQTAAADLFITPVIAPPSPRVEMWVGRPGGTP